MAIDSYAVIMSDKIKHINYALVEDTRPPMYKATKYWGKKPHNIWGEFIKAYTSEGGVTLDPFAGSAVAAFESVKANKKAIAFDLNPLTSFMIESITSEFSEDRFIQEFNKIEEVVQKDKVYRQNYITSFEGETATIYNYKWTDGIVSSVSLKSENSVISIPPSPEVLDLAEQQNLIVNPYWFPKDKFPDNPSITYKFILDIGGDTFDNLWTKRNLYLLSLIFDLILRQKDQNLKLQLLSGFIQTLHLCTKMVVPRDSKSNRDFSGSWGRPDYMIRRRSMEQNPLIIFKRSCLEKQGILSALKDFRSTFPSGIKIHDVGASKKIKKSAHINYGIVDVADLSNYVKPGTIDFIITDPPYAGLVYYMDLSLIWLVWLKKFNNKYSPDLRAEITIKKGSVGRTEYRRRMENAFKEIHTVLKDDGYLVVTFHHKKIIEWNDFVRSVKYAGFKFDKITHQYNRRSGESNVSNPYGTSGADFYIRCVKHRNIDFTDDQSGLESFVRQKAIEIVAERNQPTPSTILISSLIPELLQAGFFQPDEYKNEIEKILNGICGEGKTFFKKENLENKAGDYWWFNVPSDHINFPDLPLDRRAEDLILSILRKNVSVKFDDIIGELFKTFPNGLTPDPRNIVKLISKYAYKSAERWKIKEDTVLSITQHTLLIESLLKIASKIGYSSFVGKREQPERTSNGTKLSELADMLTLKGIGGLQPQTLQRVEMIDCVWLKENKKEIECIFEVENSTDFTSAIQRGSNLPPIILKFMIIPNHREVELKRIEDPYFVNGFNSEGWKYLTYDDINLLASYSKVSLKDLILKSKNINGRIS